MLHSESPGHWTGALSDTVARGERRGGVKGRRGDDEKWRR